MPSLSRIWQYLASFLGWWSRALVTTLPRPLRRLLLPPDQRLIVSLVGSEAVFARGAGANPDKVGTIKLRDSDPAWLREGAGQIVARAGLANAPVELRLDRRQILRREVTLPLVALENLREVLGFEMDRLTPFRGEEVYYDYRLRAREPEFDRLRVELALVPRRVADAALLLLRDWGLPPVAMGIAGPKGDRLAGLNLLPNEQRRAPARLWHVVPAALAVIVVLLSVIALYLPLQRSHQAVALQEAHLAELRQEAARAEELKGQLDTLLEQDRFTAGRKTAGPTASALIADLTRRIPDDTWIQQLSWREDGLRLAGYSAHAAALIARIEDSPFFLEVRFASPVTPDPYQGLERFNIQGRVAGQDQ
jgi:general secretion pathway protein L